MHAVGRIAYRGWIDNVQVSWVKCGVGGARQALQAGCNDLGGTLMDENISRAAGASHGQELDEREFRAIVEPLGRPLVQRTTLYGRTHTVGRRLRPPPTTTVARRRRRRRRSPARAHAGGRAERAVSRLDVVAHRQRAGRRAEPRDRRVRRRARASSAGAMDAHRHRPRRASSTRRWARRIEISGGSAANTIGRASRRSAGRAAFIGRVADDKLGKVFAPRPARRGRASSTRRPRPTATPHRPLPRDRHARRRAHDEHLPRRVGASSTATTSTPTWSRAPRSRTSRATSGTRPRRKDAYPPRGRARARRRPPGRAHALRPVLRRPAPRRVPRARSSATSTCCSPTRPRSRRSTRSTTFDDALAARRATTARSPRSPAARRAR